MPPTKMNSNVILAMNENILLDKLEDIDNKLVSIDHALNGNGQPGLKTRVAIIEEAEKNRSYYIKAILTAVLTSLVTSIWALIAR